MTAAARRAGRQPLNSGAPWSFPPPWVRAWRQDWLAGDLSAGVVVAIMLVPQSLAYAMLAGLPAQVGLMASLLPLLGYAAFGTSGALSVGPGAITSLMVFQALSPLAVPGGISYGVLSAALALGSGLLLMLMGGLRLGFLSQLLSRPVVQGFTVASALLIMLGQVASLMGWKSLGSTLPDMLEQLMQHVLTWPAGAVNGNAQVGLASVALLWAGPKLLNRVGRAVGLSAARVQIGVRLWPLGVLLSAAWIAQHLLSTGAGPISLVGEVKLNVAAARDSLLQLGESLPAVWQPLAMPVLLVALVNFVSSMSVAQNFALRQGLRVDADRELIGLGVANLGSTVLGGMAVTGGLSRSVVNDAAGARSPLAGVITALILGIMMALFLPWLSYLPKSALAAVIVMAVVGLIDFRPLRQAWVYDRADAWAFVATALGVLLVGFETGILIGIAWSLGTLIWRHSQPHMAEVGRVPGTHHFRNVNRHRVEQLNGVLMVRVDESLDFTNIQRVELRLCELVHGRERIERIVLLLSAVNHIDHSAMQTLLELDRNLSDQGRCLYLAEVKGPLMDRLKHSRMDALFEGRIFLSAQHAWDALA
ncbi:MAG: SulP family inorganic anion transporter [Burkholderiales bacterium]|nr:SulP family inorganic anion transporter [Burkholderiales bacterium]MDE2431519.1 SulP family inorganic anion transporter [Burkholderiales bacterium]